MTPQTPLPGIPSPYVTEVTAKDKFGNVTTVQPGALIEYATQATAFAMQASLTAQIPEGAPYSLVDINAGSAGLAWSAPMYGIQATGGQVFNAGLVYKSISQGGYNAYLTISQIRSAITGS